jgi:hypothetical protein
MNTPWGQSQVIEKIAEGIDFVSTAGHGGMKLSADNNAKVPLSWREASFKQQGLQGWYEEDCDVAMVMITFPMCFSENNVARAKEAMQHCYPQCDLSLVKPSLPFTKEQQETMVDKLNKAIKS